MESTFQFIEVIKKHGPIYDTTNKDYKNMEKKANAWMSVSSEVGLSVEACKRKWKNLRDSYTKYLRSYRTGAKASKKYQCWAHANHMDFLRPFQGPGRSQNMKVSVFPQLAQKKSESSCDLKLEIFDKTPIENIFNTKIRNIEQHKNINLLQNNEPLTNDERNIIKQIELDATGMFFLSLAKSVRAMPRKYQVDVKMRCMKIVSDVEMELENSQLSMNNLLQLNDRSLKNQCNNSEDFSNQLQLDSFTQQTDNSEHFLYVMSPSRVEAMIDISSDDEQPDIKN